MIFRKRLSSITALLSLYATLALAFLAFLAFAPNALAQHSSDLGNAPPPPPGPGSLTVALVGDTDPEKLVGVRIALYVLSADGTPGLATGELDADGTFSFDGISNNPEIGYLVIAAYADIPFTARVAFEAGSTTANIEIPVSEPTSKITGVSVEEVRLDVEWMGDRIVVTEAIRLISKGDRVIKVAPSDTGATIVERRLPSEAKDFNAGPLSTEENLVEVDGNVRFYGPLYPGDQRIEYQYSLPVDRETDALRFSVSLREAINRVVVAAGTSGIQVMGRELTPSSGLTSKSGQSIEAWARPGLSAGESFEVGLVLPESRLDPTALSIPRADVWIDLDDTQLNANVDLQLLVAPGAPLSGTPDTPLLHITIPTGASLEGVAPQSESMGLVPRADGGFNVIGPIGPGEHSLAYSFRRPSRTDGVTLDMRFPREVQTLNVLIADIGLALDSSRLHRRRPFRNRTRNYLHREAYNVSQDEVVDLTLTPLRAEGLSQSASVGLTVVAVAGAALFLIAPLRGRRHVRAASDPELDRLLEKRESVYTAIADLEHDFETGKLEKADYAAMREELKAEAIELIKRERRAEGSVDASSTPAPNTISAATPNFSAEAASNDVQVTGAFCPNCGDRVDSRWRFCSHCGGDLQPMDTSAENQG